MPPCRTPETRPVVGGGDGRRARVIPSRHRLPADRFAAVAEATELYARCRNRLDAAPLVRALADDVRYASQDVLESLCGRAAVGTYLERRFAFIAGVAPSRDTGRLELGSVDPPEARDQPCAIFHQDGRRLALTTSRTDAAGRISEIFTITVVRSAEAARGSGVFPA